MNRRKECAPWKRRGRSPSCYSTRWITWTAYWLSTVRSTGTAWRRARSGSGRRSVELIQNRATACRRIDLLGSDQRNQIPTLILFRSGQGKQRALVSGQFEPGQTGLQVLGRLIPIDFPAESNLARGRRVSFHHGGDLRTVGSLQNELMTSAGFLQI